MQEVLRDMGLICGWEDPWRRACPAQSGIPTWRIRWTEEPGGLQFHGVIKESWHDWTDSAHMHSILTHAIPIQAHTRQYNYSEFRIQAENGWQHWDQRYCKSEEAGISNGRNNQALFPRNLWRPKMYFREERGQDTSSSRWFQVKSTGGVFKVGSDIWLWQRVQWVGSMTWRLHSHLVPYAHHATIKRSLYNFHNTFKLFHCVPSKSPYPQSLSLTYSLDDWHRLWVWT